MPISRILLLAAGLALGALAQAGEAPALPASDAAASAAGALPNAAPSAQAPSLPGASLPRTKRSNICFGGLEDGKLIPQDDRVQNPFRQTSLLGCSVDGGRPAFLPDLKPAVPDGTLA